MFSGNEAIPAKHLFYIMDACYSGLALLRSGPAEAAGDRRKYLAEITRRSARQIPTAGGADQLVADNGPNGHSIFTLSPSNAQVANNIGFVYYKQGDYERALTWYERTLALDPTRAIAWVNKGELFEKMERKADAESAYKKFLEIAPAHPSPAYVRSRLTLLEGTSN